MRVEQTRCERCDVERPPPRCPWCGAVRDSRWTGAEDDARLERRLRLIVVPALLVLAGLALRSDGMRSVARTFLSMWVHEIGHAVTAWFTGFAAFPGPWRTILGSERSALVVVLVAAALALAGWRAHQARSRPLLAAVIALLALQLAGTFLASSAGAQMAITFGGDAGMLVLGGALLATFWAPVGSHLHTSWLRWGFAVIGAFAFMDAFTSWWAARRDPGVIPYGEIEGVGLSDPTKLVDIHGWSQQQLIDRHVWLGCLVLAALALGHLWANRPMPRR